MDTKLYDVMANFANDFIDYYLVRATDLEEAEKEFYNRVENETAYSKEEVIILTITEEK